MEEKTTPKTFGNIKVYEDIRDIVGQSKKVSVVEIPSDFEDIRYFLDVYDELTATTQPLLVTGPKIPAKIIESLLQILCEQFMVIEVTQPRFLENLELIVDLFLVNVDHETMDIDVLKRYVDIWNGRNLFFYFKPRGSGELKEFEELVKELGLAEKNIPFRIEEECQV